ADQGDDRDARRQAGDRQHQQPRHHRDPGIPRRARAGPERATEGESVMMKRRGLEGRRACFETPLAGLFSMRCFLRATKSSPHPEERGRASARARVSKDAGWHCSASLPLALLLLAIAAATPALAQERSEVALVKVVDGEVFA